jgi:hypothetical protein
VTRVPDAVFGACFASPYFPWPPPLAPSTPPLAAQLRSWTSQLLRRGLTSRVRSSSASAHHLPCCFQNYLAYCFRAIWRSVGAPLQSQTEAVTNMAAIQKQNRIFTPIVRATLGSREGTLALPRRSSALSGTPNSSETLRHIAIRATVRSPKHPVRLACSTSFGSPLCSSIATVVRQN